MEVDFDHTNDAVCAWAKSQGIAIREAPLAANKAGEFDGTSATMNTAYSSEERSYYLAHALGSMVRWSLSFPEIQALFQELRAAKRKKRANPDRLELAIARYRAFEIESSQFAVWLLSHVGCGRAVDQYTNFMRADLEALTQFHRLDRAPVWRDFFSGWNEQVAQGVRSVLPFPPKPIPPFQAKEIPVQEILQEQPSEGCGRPGRRRAS